MTLDQNPYAPPREASGPCSQARSGMAKIDVDTMMRAYRVHFGWRTILLRTAIAAAGLTLGLTLLQFRPLAGLAIFFVSLIFLGRTVAWRPMLRRDVARQWKQMGKTQEIVHFEPTAEHLRISTADSENRIAWTKFRKWREQDGLILAYYHNRFFHVIPTDQLGEDVQGLIRQQLSIHSPRKD